MNEKLLAYGTLCSLFYDATKKYAPLKEVDFYASFVEQKPGRVLEAMSGSGRLQIPLLQRGYIIDGVDNSPAMLSRCRERCAQLNITAELYEQSLTELSIAHKYATVTIAVGSFQLIVDRQAALQSLKNLRAHMIDNGNLLIDIFVPDVTHERSTKIVHIDHGQVIRLTTRNIFYHEEKRVDAFCSYELLVNGVATQQEDELIQVVWYEDNALEQLLLQAGFNLITIYDQEFRTTGPSRIVHARAV